MNPSPETSALLDMLERCERDDALPADLAALSALLEQQEESAAWGSIRGGLQQGLLAEGDLVDVAPGVLGKVALGVDAARPALDALRGGLHAEAGQADVADAVMHVVAPRPEPVLDRHLAALAAGLRRDARSHLPSDFAAEVLDRVAPDRDRVLDLGFQVLAHELGALAADIAVADPVMEAVLGECGWQLDLCAMVDGELSDDARRAVAVRLADDPESRRAITAMADLGRALRNAVAHETAGHDLGAIWTSVSAELGIQEQAGWAVSMAQGIQDEAGAIDIADLVMDSILPAAVRSEAATEALETPSPEAVVVAESRPSHVAVPWFRRLPLFTVAISAASLLFVLNSLGPPATGPGTPPVDQPELAQSIFMISDVNTIEIEQLEVAENAMVQVFQLEEGAPMVILIDEGLEPGSVEGVTL